MMEADLPPLVIDTFLRQYESVAAGETGLIPQAGIAPPSSVHALRPAPPHTESSALAETVVLKLNGGLGTGMGLRNAKSLLIAKQGLSFLDIIAKQVLHLRRKHGVDLPLVLMNSFRTDTPSRDALIAHQDLAPRQAPIDIGFTQHKVPKLSQADLSPVTWPDDPDLCWCPPGHGDLYTALVTSGALQAMRARGFRYAFVSNADNLGATLDLNILTHFAESHSPFMMEVTTRTDADRKGGHLAEDGHGRLLLRERAQCPADEVEAFENIERFRFFNTNNIWIRLDKLEQRMAEQSNILNLPLIVNHKTVDPTDPSSTPVYQLETAMGAAIGVFPDATALQVPRSRFAPVKSTDDLLAVRSNAYTLEEDFRVVLATARNDSPPDIRLDPRYYKMLPDFEQRFPHGAPALLDCQSLTVEGDVTFGRDTKLHGDVHLTAGSEKMSCLPDGTTIRGTAEDHISV